MNWIILLLPLFVWVILVMIKSNIQARQDHEEFMSALRKENKLKEKQHGASNNTYTN